MLSQYCSFCTVFAAQQQQDTTDFVAQGCPCASSPDGRAAGAGVEIAWELPPGRHAACMLQTQLSEKSPQAVNKATHRAWAAEYGVICLGGASTFFTIDGADEPQFWPPDSLRQALKPSGAFTG